MMQDLPYFRLIQQFLYELHGLNINYINNYDSDISSLDFGLRNQTNQSVKLYNDLRKVLRSLPFGTIYIFQDSFLLSYVFFLAAPKDDSFYAVGPYRSSELTDSDYEVIKTKNHIMDNEIDAIRVLMQKIPTDIKRNIPLLTAKNLLQSLHENLEISIHDISLEIIPYVPKEDMVSHIHGVETCYYHESMLMHHVSEGNHTKAIQEARYFINAPMTNRLSDPVMSQRGLLFTSNTLLRKAAQSIGIHPLFLDEISTRFARILSSCKTHEQLDDTFISMVLDYCTLCRVYKNQNYSEPVQKIINYILSNISVDLSPSNIAKFVNFSPSYIARKFKEEVGVTLVNYITEQRIRIAKDLLLKHNMQVQDVASYVGISDWNFLPKYSKSTLELLLAIIVKT